MQTVHGDEQDGVGQSYSGVEERDMVLIDKEPYPYFHYFHEELTYKARLTARPDPL